jgi:hypothetical protein
MTSTTKIIALFIAVILTATAIGMFGVGSSIVDAAFASIQSDRNLAVPDSEPPVDTVSITNFSSVYTQNFNSLATSGSSNPLSELPAGWIVYRSDDGTTYKADNGSDTVSNIFSYGSTGSSDRALGILDDSSMTGSLGAVFTNNTGAEIGALVISYVGEQWRRGAGSGDGLSFSYCVGCSDLVDGTWTGFSSLNFVSPFQGNPTNRSEDGNASNRRTAFSNVIVPVSVPNGSSVTIRWTATNVTGADDGHGIDDFSLRAAPAVPETTLTSSPNLVSNSTSASFSFTSDGAGATFECRLNSGSWAACTSPRSLSGLSQGSNTFEVRATALGETDPTPASYTWVVDTVAPTVAFTSSPTGTRTVKSETISFSATDAGSGIDFTECRLNTGSYSQCVSPVTLTNLAEGGQTFSVRATDNAGNVSSVLSASWTVDSIAPTVTNFTPFTNSTSTSARSQEITVTDATSNVSSVTISYSVISAPAGDAPEGTFVKGFDDLSSSPCTVVNAPQGRFNCSIPGTVAGSAVQYSITATDTPGNIRRLPSVGTYTYLVLNSSGKTDLPPGEYGNLTIDGSNISINGDISVSGTLTLTGAVESTGTVTFGCSGTSAGTGFLVGTVEKEFCGATSFTYPIGTNVIVGAVSGQELDETLSTPVSAPATVTVTSVNGPSSLSVNAFLGRMPGVGTDYLNIYWETLEDGDITADLRFGWVASAEIGNSANYQGLIRRPVGGTAVVDGSSVTPASRFVDFPDVSEFDSGVTIQEGGLGVFAIPYLWTAALYGSTAGGDNELTGRVVSAEGRPLRGVTVTLIGGSLVEPMTITTNQFGVYRFAGLGAGSTYVISVNSGRHTFGNNVRVVYLADSLSGEDFVADQK